MSGLGVSKELRRLTADNVELSSYLFVLAKVSEDERELVYVKSEKLPKSMGLGKADYPVLPDTEYAPDNEDPKDAIERVKEILLQEKACFLIYNFFYGPSNKSAKFFLVRWVDDSKASIRTKMTYASSTGGVKAKMPNLAVNFLQCCDASDFTHEKFLECIRSK